MSCEKSVVLKKKWSFDCPHCGGKSTVVYNDDHQPTKKQEKAVLNWYSGHIKRVGGRVWWKPWTWRRKSPLMTFWPLAGGKAQAVNPDIPPDWDGRRWVVTDNDKFRRIIFVDHFTPESLVRLGFDGDPEAIIIFPVNQEK